MTDGDDNDDGNVNDDAHVDDGVENSVPIAPGRMHKNLESPRLYSLDMLQQNILILEQHKNLVVTRHGHPFRKTRRIP
jgi:hypothetical protein